MPSHLTLNATLFAVLVTGALALGKPLSSRAAAADTKAVKTVQLERVVISGKRSST